MRPIQLSLSGSPVMSISKSKFVAFDRETFLLFRGKATGFS